jgi:hypothetical protein
MRFRIGIHVGDIMVQGDNLFGEGVNIAARLEALAEPGGICVSGTVRDQIGTKLPLSFADLGEQQVKNITQPIKAYRIRSETSPIDTPVVGSYLPLPDKPSIAVLPFANMSRDPEQEYFADGMVEELITALSRIRWLFVIARNSSFTYKGRSVDVKQTSLRLNPRDRMEGLSLTGIGVALFLRRRFEDAVTRLVVSLEKLPSFTTTYRFLASCYAHMGRLDEAQEVVNRLRAITSVVATTLVNSTSKPSPVVLTIRPRVPLP